MNAKVYGLIETDERAWLPEFKQRELLEDFATANGLEIEAFINDRTEATTRFDAGHTILRCDFADQEVHKLCKA